MVRGHKANMFLSGKDIVRSERVYADEVEPLTIQAPPLSDPLPAHHRNFYECIRDRTKKPNCPIDIAHKVMVTLALAELSYRESRMRIFDPETQRVVAGTSVRYTFGAG